VGRAAAEVALVRKTITIALSNRAAPKKPSGPSRSPSRIHARSVLVSGSSNEMIVDVVTGVVRSPSTSRAYPPTDIPGRGARRAVNRTRDAYPQSRSDLPGAD
jgi:hypothetical protein